MTSERANHAASAFAVLRISTSAEMPRRSCSRRIIAIERLRLATEDFRDACARPKHRFEIAKREASLFHPEFDRLDRVGRVDWNMLALVSVDERREDVEPVAFRRPGLPTP